MSHFKVLVIGENVDDQLAPYDENMEVDEYQDPDFNFVEEVARARSFYIRHPDLGIDAVNASDHAVLTRYNGGESGLHWNDDGTEATQWSTYNPKSKWDYWTIGGRYNASMKIKADAAPDDFEPSEVHWSEKFGNAADHTNASDRARKRAVDYPVMIAAARADAEVQWAKLAEATGDIEPPTTGWNGYRAKYPSIDDARAEWNMHPWNVAVRAAGLWDGYEDFHMDAEDPRAAYIAHREAMAVTGYYAVVKDGEWTARGDMGWFGVSDDKVTVGDWRSKLRELIDGLPDDTWLTTVDCHI